MDSRRKIRFPPKGTGFTDGEGRAAALGPRLGSSRGVPTSIPLLEITKSLSQGKSLPSKSTCALSGFGILFPSASFPDKARADVPGHSDGEDPPPRAAHKTTTGCARGPAPFEVTRGEG